MTLPEMYNAVEVVLWAACGAGTGAAALKAQGRARLRCLLASAAFFAFAVSDAIELRTGAWWRPPSLLVLKVICVAALILLYFDYVRARRQGGTDKRSSGSG